MPTNSKIVDAAREHVETVVAPAIEGWHRENVFPRGAVEAAGRSGLTRLYAPTSRAGLGLTPADTAACFEEFGRVDALYGFVLSMHNLVTMASATAHPDSSAGKWAPALGRAEALGSFLLTEAPGGSDPVGNMTTRAVPNPGGYVLNGRKAWASLAGEADVYAVVCRSGDGDKGTRDMMMLLVQADDPGVRVSRVYDKSTAAYLPIGDVDFEDVHLPADRVIAPAGEGFQLAMAAIDIARLNVAASAVGLAAGALDVALADVAKRRLFGSSVLELQAIQFALVDVETAIQAGRLLYNRAGSLIHRPGGAVAVAHAKRFCPDAAVDAAITCTRVMGANGSLTSHPIPRFLATAQLLTMVDGASGIQRMIIGRELLRRSAELSPYSGSSDLGVE